MKQFAKYFIALITISVAIYACSDDDNDPNNCNGVVCQNGASCVDGQCECINGFIGPNCEFSPCSVVDCDLNSGTLVQDSTSCTCVCDSLYYGSDCSQLDLCAVNGTNCINGTCNPATGDCECDTGYEGDSCQFGAFEKYIGLYLVDERCGTDTGIAFNTFQSSIDTSAAPDHVFITNVSERMTPVTGLVLQDFIQLPEKNYGLYRLLEGEVYHNDTTGNLAVNYIYKHNATGRTFTCDATYIRQ